MATKFPAIPPNYNKLTSLRRAVRESPLLAELLRHHQYIGKDRQINDDSLTRVQMLYKGKSSAEFIRQVLQTHAANIAIQRTAEGRMICASFCTTSANLEEIRKHLQNKQQTTGFSALPPPRYRSPYRRSWAAFVRQKNGAHPPICTRSYEAPEPQEPFLAPPERKPLAERPRDHLHVVK